MERSLLFHAAAYTGRALLGGSESTNGTASHHESSYDPDTAYGRFFLRINIIGGVPAFLASIIGFYMIQKHLKNYVEPIFQRYVVRVIFMVPVFGICAWLALVLPEHDKIYAESALGIYEAYVLYNFVALCIEFLGGPGSIVVKLEGHTYPGTWLMCTCHLKGAPIDGNFVRNCKRGMIQFVITKPCVVTFEIILHLLGKLDEDSYSPAKGYLWCMIVYNISYTWALYALMNFYVGCHHVLAPMKPLLKFSVIKIVVFFTFWQGMFCGILVSMGVLHSSEDATIFKNFLLCAEMFFIALSIPFAFSHKEYKREATGRIMTNWWASLKHSFSLDDFLSDTRHQFSNKYHDYVLYADMVRNKRGEEGPTGSKAFIKGLGHLLGTDGKKGGGEHGGGEREVELGDTDSLLSDKHLVPDSASSAHTNGNGAAHKDKDLDATTSPRPPPGGVFHSASSNGAPPVPSRGGGLGLPPSASTGTLTLPPPPLGLESDSTDDPFPPPPSASLGLPPASARSRMGDATSGTRASPLLPPPGFGGAATLPFKAPSKLGLAAASAAAGASTPGQAGPSPLRPKLNLGFGGAGGDSPRRTSDGFYPPSSSPYPPPFPPALASTSDAGGAGRPPPAPGPASPPGPMQPSAAEDHGPSPGGGRGRFARTGSAKAILAAAIRDPLASLSLLSREARSDGKPAGAPPTPPTPQ